MCVRVCVYLRESVCVCVFVFVRMCAAYTVHMDAEQLIPFSTFVELFCRNVDIFIISS